MRDRRPISLLPISLLPISLLLARNEVRHILHPTFYICLHCDSRPLCSSLTAPYSFLLTPHSSLLTAYYLLLTRVDGVHAVLLTTFTTNYSLPATYYLLRMSRTERTPSRVSQLSDRRRRPAHAHENVHACAHAHACPHAHTHAHALHQCTCTYAHALYQCTCSSPTIVAKAE